MSGTGRCLCGAVTFEYEGEANWMGHCHCESCRRATASPFTSFLGVPDGKWRWSGEEPRTYRSSPGVERTFCGTCGTPMSYRTDRIPGETHFYAAALDDQSGYRPDVHFHADEMVGWIALGDDLERRS